MEWLYYFSKRMLFLLFINTGFSISANSSIQPVPYPISIYSPAGTTPTAKAKKKKLVQRVRANVITATKAHKKPRISVAGKIALSVILTIIGILGLSFAIYLLAFGGASSGLLLLIGVLGIAALIFWLITHIRKIKRKQKGAGAAS